jgi:hypothetical protein
VMVVAVVAVLLTVAAVILVITGVVAVTCCDMLVMRSERVQCATSVRPSSRGPEHGGTHSRGSATTV